MHAKWVNDDDVKEDTERCTSWEENYRNHVAKLIRAAFVEALKQLEEDGFITGCSKRNDKVTTKATR